MAVLKTISCGEPPKTLTGSPHIPPLSRMVFNARCFILTGGITCQVHPDKRGIAEVWQQEPSLSDKAD
jgi:hypothetical protein